MCVYSLLSTAYFVYHFFFERKWYIKKWKTCLCVFTFYSLKPNLHIAFFLGAPHLSWALPKPCLDLAQTLPKSCLNPNRQDVSQLGAANLGRRARGTATTVTNCCVWSWASPHAGLLYVYMYICMHTCIHIYICTYTYINTCTYTYIHTCTCTDIHTCTYIHTYKYVDVHAFTNCCVWSQALPHTGLFYVCMYVCRHACMHARMCVCVCVCLYVCGCACVSMYTCSCIHVFMLHVYIRIYIYVRIYPQRVCVCVYTCIHTYRRATKSFLLQ